LTDEQAAAEVVGAAKQIVSVAQLQGVGGGYAFESCRNADDPPYQIALYVNFLISDHDSVKYLHDVAAAMRANGWSDAPSMAEHFGYKLVNNGVTAIFHRDPDNTDVGVMRLYGQCRITSDHRHDNPVWTEIRQWG
jgi:hypothetical protein